MLDSLLVKNYRLFEHLEVDSLKRINLIVGKNNVGKTALLEALAIYFNGGLQGIVGDILRDKSYFDEKSRDLEHILGVLKDFFRDGEVQFNSDFFIETGSKNIQENKLTITFKDEELIPDMYEPMLLNKYKGKDKTSRIVDLLASNKPWQKFKAANIFHLFRTKSANNGHSLADLWDKITLTDEESHVIEGLQILAEKIEKLSFIHEGADERNPIVKIKDQKTRVKLSTMGDGMNHILAMMIHLVSCKDGYFLVDEFETGLHWSVQKDLWKVIIHLAERLNIQVFATTHSRDTIRALGEVTKEEKYENAQLVKLFYNKKDRLKANIFNTDNIETALEQNIELR